MRDTVTNVMIMALLRLRLGKRIRIALGLLLLNRLIT